MQALSLSKIHHRDRLNSTYGQAPLFLFSPWPAVFSTKEYCTSIIPTPL